MERSRLNRRASLKGGDVAEVDGLNHYIGMMKFGDAAKVERAISRFAVPLIAVITVASL